MVAISNALLTYDLNTNREDLIDAIYNISPFDTPFIASIDEVEATNVNHEWSIDVLAAAAANKQLEGDTTTRAASVIPTRPRNLCQISAKNATVSRTQAASNPAGIADMMEYQLVKKGRELRRDMEFTLTRNTGLVVGVSTTARGLRSLESWLVTNTNFGTSTGTDGADSTAETEARTDSATARAFSETILKDVIKQTYDSGGTPTVWMVGSFNKQKLSGFTGRSQARQAIAEEKIQAAADLYGSDFGDFKVVPSRFQRAQSAFAIDPEMAAVAYLPGRKMDTYQLGIVGGAVTEVIESEYTLEMRNEAAHGGAFDLTTS